MLKTAHSRYLQGLNNPQLLKIDFQAGKRK